MRILAESFDLHDPGDSGAALRSLVKDWQRRGAEVVACPTVLSLEQTRRLAPDLLVSQQWATGPAAAVANALRIPLVVLVYGSEQLAPTPMTRMAIFCAQALADAEPTAHAEDRESVVVAAPDPATDDLDEPLEGRLAGRGRQLDDCWRRMQRIVEAHTRDALLGLVMIVKDEARGIRATLESVLPCVDWWTIVDTGSVDGTPEIVREVMAGIPGELRYAPFVDFGTTRNVALAYCEPRARFQLMLSGDEVVEDAPALRQFCVERRDPDLTDPGAYDLAVRFGATTIYQSPRLTRAGAGWRYEGVTHEALVGPRGMPTAGPPSVGIRHDRPPGEEETAGESARSVGSSRVRRWRQDLDLLRQAARDKPDDARTAFYLAQTLECLQRHAEAIDAYRRRIDMGGWQEEVYESLVRVARLRHVLGHPWEQVQQAYLDAHAHSPHRAEPLVAIAKYWHDQGNHALSFLFAGRAAQIPYPTQSRLFVDADVYRYQAHDLVGVAAFHLGLYDTGRVATETALRACPGDARLQSNLDFYKARERENQATETTA